MCKCSICTVYTSDVGLTATTDNRLSDCRVAIAHLSLSNDEVYSIVADILSRNKIIPEDQKLDQSNLAGVKMLGRDKFIDLWARQKNKPY